MIKIKNFLLNSCSTLLGVGIILIALSSIVSCKNDLTSNLRLTEKELEIEKLNISSEYLGLETSYNEMLRPISILKSTHPPIYWFIVSWLGTNYRTPKWAGYSSDGWQEKTKMRGIDCSGFARVMQDKIFNKKIRGGSQGILNRYCIPISVKELELGDLVFFRAPGTKGKKIVHMGVYLMDGYFVHATSAKSAINGLGLNVNSLNEKIWSKDFVAGGKIKSQKK